jgi:multidrug efflux pump subunit AcrA (membrane-fusion protein)
MQVRSRINQADLSYLKVAQPVQVILDAYPELQFKGKLEQIAPIGLKSNFSQKMYTFISLFSIEGSDPKLIPDLSAAVDVELERIPNAVVLPRDAVSSENGRAYVRLKNGFGFKSHKVDLGAMSDDEVVIKSGVEPGAIVLRHLQALEGRSS